MTAALRDYTPDDYPAILRVHDALHPSNPSVPQPWTEPEQERDPRFKRRRWVAVAEEQVVGFASYGQSAFAYDAHRFFLWLEVLPAYQRRGIGSALYDQTVGALDAFAPRVLRADGSAHLPGGLRFAERRGFREVFRETPLHLDVAAFDPAPFAGLETRLRAQGIEVKSIRELEGDPGRDRKVYELYWEVFEDVPKENEIAPMSFDDWVAGTLRDPLTPHAAYFVATHGDEYVGLSEFGQYRDSDALQGGLVGVRRGYRNRGIAAAMHLRAIAYAQAHGHPVIKTSTSITNLAMRAAYARLGFVRQPDWIQFEKTLP